jgi:hypothetical protein
MAVVEEVEVLEQDVVDTAAQKYAVAQSQQHGVHGTTLADSVKVKVLVSTEESWKNRSLNYLPV